MGSFLPIMPNLRTKFLTVLSLTDTGGKSRALLPTDSPPAQKPGSQYETPVRQSGPISTPTAGESLTSGALAHLSSQSNITQRPRGSSTSSFKRFSPHFWVVKPKNALSKRANTGHDQE